ncbi:hypothetical protein [Alistipes sp.]|uniref:hypothetical protein n=1 Tax=Alistipes sp. TaxID=1872444 RepID=UPI0025C41DFC|nr:hypothetical protein [Alistipes sp.]
MKSWIYNIGICVTATALITGCAAEKKTPQRVSVTPSPCVVTPDEHNRVTLDMTMHVPANYLSTRCRLVMTPHLLVDDSLRCAYTPSMLDAPIFDRKMERRKRLEGYQDPYAGRTVKMDKVRKAYDLPYNETITLPEDVDEGRIVAVVEANGCGRCRTMDTVTVASVTNPVTLIPEAKEAMHLDWIEPEFVIRPKVVEGRGVARLQFAINSYGIDLEMGDNRSELEQMTRTLAPILEDSLATLSSLKIIGMASADGRLATNSRLAHQRAEAAAKWLTAQLDPSQQTLHGISIGSRPEGWQPVVDAMIQAQDRDTAAVLGVLRKYADRDDDVQEYFIRRLPCWPKIRNRYLQKDRKVEYLYTYHIKSFTTDEELRAMYSRRPDAFNEEELLRVATLAQSPEEKKEVYHTLLHYFPSSQVAANNLAVLYLREGKTEEAQRIVAIPESCSEEMLNTLAVSYVYTNDYEKAVELLQEIDSPQARYNLGIIRAKQRQLTEAHELMQPFRDLNSAICALSVNRTEEADGIMRQIDDERPVAEYVRALIAARQGDGKAVMRHLAPACREEQLRKRAANEGVFLPYHELEEFRSILAPEAEDLQTELRK